MLRKFVIFIAILPASLPGMLRAQDCPGLSVLSAFINPWNNSEVLLLSENTDPDIIYDYPSWHLLDPAGVDLGAETVNYFGLYGLLWHVVTLNEPWVGTAAMENCTWQLWQGFDESAVCAIEQTFEPRTWAHAGTGPEGCAPLRVELSAPGAAASAWAWSLTDASGIVLGEGSGSFVEDQIWYALSESLCLSQTECHTLSVSSDGGPVFAQFIHASSWHPLPGLSVMSGENGEEASIAVDLYGGDCISNAIHSTATVPDRFTVYPNPTDGAVHIEPLPGKWFLLDAQGRQLDLPSPQSTIDLSGLPIGSYFLWLDGEVQPLIRTSNR
jgi:hypothetical protein